MQNPLYIQQQTAPPTPRTLTLEQADQLPRLALPRLVAGRFGRRGPVFRARELARQLRALHVGRQAAKRALGAAALLGEGMIGGREGGDGEQGGGGLKG
jgi:hypothetical protein